MLSLVLPNTTMANAPPRPDSPTAVLVCFELPCPRHQAAAYTMLAGHLPCLQPTPAAAADACHSRWHRLTCGAAPSPRGCGRAEAHGRVAQVTKDLGEVKADRQAKDRELSEASSEVAKANDACHRLKIKLNERKQAATALAAALASELGLPSDVQAALESQEAGQLSGVLGKLGSLVRPHALQADMQLPCSP